ncbi:hypothetical protein [Streptomyces sp. NPDC006335]|uniref:hypothetical protein n=1 Tax=Streptomyces sp. NPDC006335 TaxID=3156895 RepID=UPI0033ACFCDE
MDAHELAASRRPDILLRQEATYSDLDDERRLKRLKADEEPLEMKGYLSPNNGGRNPTAMFIRQTTFPISERVHWAEIEPGIAVTRSAFQSHAYLVPATTGDRTA